MSPISKKDLEALAEVDVLSRGAPTEVDSEIESKIAELQKGSSVTIKLSSDELIRAKREAATIGLDYKTYIKQKVSQMFEGSIGRSTIVGPTWASGAKITGPTNLSRMK